MTGVGGSSKAHTQQGTTHCFSITARRPISCRGLTDPCVSMDMHAGALQVGTQPGSPSRSCPSHGIRLLVGRQAAPPLRRVGSRGHTSFRRQVGYCLARPCAAHAMPQSSPAPARRPTVIHFPPCWVPTAAFTWRHQCSTIQQLRQHHSPQLVHPRRGVPHASPCRAAPPLPPCQHMPPVAPHQHTHPPPPHRVGFMSSGKVPPCRAMLCPCPHLVLSFISSGNSSCGTSMLPRRFMRRLPSRCLSSSLRLRLTSPP